MCCYSICKKTGQSTIRTTYNTPFCLKYSPIDHKTVLPHRGDVIIRS
ncbi:hypothetical protein NC99_00280 [Sunxiuqinia dokdonensis]|uniref:Uncharacterized protein n=1 Tax=Sunxiuqinia dokdonensis TaxID=1409788 RepID=A0A0L8VFE7_9BACT|nr:hypothetical protein NC99_00280 [Sunxiuqinia dokdonensis]